MVRDDKWIIRLPRLPIITQSLKFKEMRLRQSPSPGHVVPTKKKTPHNVEQTLQDLAAENDPEKRDTLIADRIANGFGSSTHRPAAPAYVEFLHRRGKVLAKLGDAQAHEREVNEWAVTSRSTGRSKGTPPTRENFLGVLRFYAEAATKFQYFGKNDSENIFAGVQQLINQGKSRGKKRARDSRETVPIAPAPAVRLQQQMQENLPQQSPLDAASWHVAYPLPPSASESGIEYSMMQQSVRGEPPAFSAFSSYNPAVQAAIPASLEQPLQPYDFQPFAQQPGGDGQPAYGALPAGTLPQYGLPAKSPYGPSSVLQPQQDLVPLLSAPFAPSQGIDDSAFPAAPDLRSAELPAQQLHGLPYQAPYGPLPTVEATFGGPLRRQNDPLTGEPRQVGQPMQGQQRVFSMEPMEPEPYAPLRRVAPPTHAGVLPTQQPPPTAMRALGGVGRSRRFWVYSARTRTTTWRARWGKLAAGSRESRAKVESRPCKLLIGNPLRRVHRLAIAKPYSFPSIQRPRIHKCLRVANP